jgi:hypothetical protein
MRDALGGVTAPGRQGRDAKDREKAAPTGADAPGG